MEINMVYAKRGRFINAWIVGGCIVLASSIVEATEPAKSSSDLTHIHFQANVSEKVAANTMQATLRLEVKHRQPASAAKELNQKLQEAMRRVRADESIHVETSQYATQQLYDEKGKAKDWQVSVELTMTSQQWNTLGDHIAALQNQGWLFSGVSFEVSADQRKNVEKRLTEKGLEEWQDQAERIAKQLQLKKWHIGHVDISHSGSITPPRLFKAARMSLMAESAAPIAPDMAGSDTLVQMVIDGEIVGEK
jgi:predicted secreted protein